MCLTSSFLQSQSSGRKKMVCNKTIQLKMKLSVTIVDFDTDKTTSRGRGGGRKGHSDIQFKQRSKCEDNNQLAYFAFHRGKPRDVADARTSIGSVSLFKLHLKENGRVH